MEKPSLDIARVRELSPRRNTTRAAALPELVDEQLRHFSIDPDSEFGRRMGELASHLYAGNAAAHQLWEVTLRELADLDPRDRVARFNAKRFLCFQLAKILDTLQNPLRKSYQSLLHDSTQSAIKGPYPIFDNVTAIFSATPVITRTATYLYACTEWVEDAFKGREPLHEIYSRLLNPTSISLANHIVDLEAGPLAGEYLAWNFNSGMAAIDATLSNLVGYNDVVLSSRNVYGGTYQLLHDWYAKKSNLDVAVEWFDGFTVDDFGRALHATLDKHRDRLDRGRRIYVFLESPCNPHGYVLDVPAICRAAHEYGLTVICDATVGTPILQPVLQRKDPMERPDFVIHSYTKDLAGTGTTTAINVQCSAVEGNENYALRERLMFLGLPAPLFTIDLDTEMGRRISRHAFQRFFDCLEPAFGLQVTLGQVNTVVVCPALTSHSELSTDALHEAGISLTTIRIAVGDEDPRGLLAHLMQAAELALEPECPGFTRHFGQPHEIDALYESTYVDVHRRYAASRPRMRQMLEK